jgi:hypothetical protein
MVLSADDDIVAQTSPVQVTMDIQGRIVPDAAIIDAIENKSRERIGEEVTSNYQQLPENL